MLDTKKSYCPGCGVPVMRAGPCSETCTRVTRVWSGAATISKEKLCDELARVDEETQAMSTKYPNGASCLRVGTDARVLRQRVRALKWDEVPSDIKHDFGIILHQLCTYKNEFEKSVSGKIKLPLKDEGEWLQLRPLTDYEKKMREEVALEVESKWKDEPVDPKLFKPELNGEFRVGVDVAIGKDYTATFQIKRGDLEAHEVKLMEPSPDGMSVFSRLMKEMDQKMHDAVFGGSLRAMHETPKLPEFTGRRGEKLMVKRKYDCSTGKHLDTIALLLGLRREDRRRIETNTVSPETDDELRARVYAADEARGGGVSAPAPFVGTPQRRGDGVHAYDGRETSRF
jgi:hypothetical protein